MINQVPITTNPSLRELLHEPMLLRVTIYEEGLPFKPERPTLAERYIECDSNEDYPQ